MLEDVAGRLNEVVTALERNIVVADESGADCAAALLRMARLDLLTHIHGISDEELEALRNALDANNQNYERKMHIH
jgi:hypothetical protein